ncbi:MAG: signal peptidase I [Gammaproteobacteria bacterium]
MSPDFHFDLELALLIGAVVTGLVWLLDKLFLGDKRRKRALENSYNSTHSQEAVEPRSKDYREPWFIDLCKSFFPILLIVLILRSFVAEPFRIPSGSMMPTLLHGDFILVNKFSYGIRLPVWHKKILNIGSPQRGDVAVFRYPKNPADDYIKRVIGLPGDHIIYRNKKLYINGDLVSQEKNGIYQGKGANSVMNGATIFRENLKQPHNILLKKFGNYALGEYTVPQNHFFVMGDNRDHSSDSRIWGFVPEENLVGRAFLVWMNWDFTGKKFNFNRVGKKII